MPTSSALQRWLAAAIVVAAAALLASAFLAGSTPDEEEFRYTVLTSWLHVRALADGRYAFWTSQLGFGLPQPLIANYWLHPLLPLLAWMSPAAWMRLLLLVHSSLGALGMWRLCRAVDVRPLVASVGAATFLLAAPSQNYLLTDFWPSPWIALTSMPWVLLCAWRVLEGPDRHRWRWTALLGLVSGLIVANGNPGTSVIYGVLVPALVLVRPRESIEQWRHLAVAGAIMLAIAAPNATLLLSERHFFPPESAMTGGGHPLGVSVAWDVFLRPLSATAEAWQADIVTRGARTLFFGGPFAVLCLVACARIGWQRPELVLALAIALVEMLSAAAPAMGASERYLFRDPIVLCAIPLAAMAAERGLRLAWARLPTALLLVAQLSVVVLAALPLLSETWTERREGAEHVRGAVADHEIPDMLVAAMPDGGRVLYSPRVDEDVGSGELRSSGLGVNALAYRGVPMVNGWFKGVSAAPIWPDERFYYSRIKTPQALAESDVTLDALGIRYLLATQGERVAAGLRPVRVLPTRRLPLVLYENPDAWPGAFLLDDGASGAELPRFAPCGNDRLLCRDFAPLSARRLDADVAIVRHEGDIDVTLSPLETPALLVLSEMFRPAWRASSGGSALPTQAFAGGLLAVRVPAGARAVRFVYRPWPLIAATFLAGSAILASLVVLASAVYIRWR